VIEGFGSGGAGGFFVLMDQARQETETSPYRLGVKPTERQGYGPATETTPAPMFTSLPWSEAEDIARRIAAEETERTRKMTDNYRLGGHNDLFDAERHARWTYRMSMELGAVYADLFSTGHEFEGLLTQPLIEMSMDLLNNSVGMAAALNGSGMPTMSTPGLVYISDGRLVRR
jgi:hypothetical protein